MDEKETDTQRPCEHHYEFKSARVSNDETEFVKKWVCTECGHECERRHPRIGARKTPRVIA